jgi:TetR/AcrR family transcriptional repressor of nem operon
MASSSSRSTPRSSVGARQKRQGPEPEVHQTRDRLLEATSELLLERSYGAVSIDDVCQRAHARKGSFYHFFRSKRDLVLEVVERWEATCVKTIFEPAFHSGLAPLKQIEKAFEILCEQQDRTFRKTGHLLGCMAGNLALEMSAQDRQIRKKTRGVFESFARYFEGALRAAVDQGQIVQKNAANVARQLVAFLEGVVLLAKAYDDPLVINELCLGAIAIAMQPSIPPSRGKADQTHARSKRPSTSTRRKKTS